MSGTVHWFHREIARGALSSPSDKSCRSLGGDDGEYGNHQGQPGRRPSHPAAAQSRSPSRDFSDSRYSSLPCWRGVLAQFVAESPSTAIHTTAHGAVCPQSMPTVPTPRSGERHKGNRVPFVVVASTYRGGAPKTRRRLAGRCEFVEYEELVPAALPPARILDGFGVADHQQRTVREAKFVRGSVPCGTQHTGIADLGRLRRQRLFQLTVGAAERPDTDTGLADASPNGVANHLPRDSSWPAAS